MTQTPAAEARNRRRSASRLSDEMRIALAPARTFEALIAEGAAPSWLRLLAGTGLCCSCLPLPCR